MGTLLSFAGHLHNRGKRQTILLFNWLRPLKLPQPTLNLAMFGPGAENGGSWLCIIGNIYKMFKKRKRILFYCQLSTKIFQLLLEMFILLLQSRQIIMFVRKVWGWLISHFIFFLIRPFLSGVKTGVANHRQSYIGTFTLSLSQQNKCY